MIEETAMLCPYNIILGRDKALPFPVSQGVQPELI